MEAANMTDSVAAAAAAAAAAAVTAAAAATGAPLKLPFGFGNFGGPGANADLAPALSPFALIDMFIPGFSLTVSTVQRYLGIDLTLYLPLFLLYTGLTFVWKYVSNYAWDLAERYLMSVCELKPDDELYYQVLAWVAAQRFAQRSRRFIANSSLRGNWWWFWMDDDDEDDGGDDEDLVIDGDEVIAANPERKKPLSYTPSFGSHSFWFKGRLLRFTRSQKSERHGWSTSDKEEIAISCFGRNPWILKDLLVEARQLHFKKDEQKTFIYRGTSRNGGDVSWQRCMSRTPRPFSTVILDEKVKRSMIADMTDYLNPSTRRWYSNRGIPYRRGYLLWGPPGTGKSSFSLALAGYFKMRIYMVSLSSSAASEENLANLFAELPRRCVVLLEDIDTAGLTHTRDASQYDDENNDGDDESDSDKNARRRRHGRHKKDSGNNSNNSSTRLSLSGLLNILDGVASQEGRILIMTTNHLDKLDKALIRPGRVDMSVKFGLATQQMASAIFRAIFSPQAVDVSPATRARLEADAKTDSQTRQTVSSQLKGLVAVQEDPRPDEKKLLDLARAKQATAAAALAEDNADKIRNITNLAEQFGSKMTNEEFSLAEVQGFLLKHKRDPEGAVAELDEWMVQTRIDKTFKAKRDEAKALRKKEKEKMKNAKARRKEKRAAAKKKKEKEKKKKEKLKERQDRRKTRQEEKDARIAEGKGTESDAVPAELSSSSDSESSSSSGSGSSSDSDSDFEIGSGSGSYGPITSAAAALEKKEAKKEEKEAKKEAKKEEKQAKKDAKKEEKETKKEEENKKKKQAEASAPKGDDKESPAAAAAAAAADHVAEGQQAESQAEPAGENEESRKQEVVADSTKDDAFPGGSGTATPPSEAD